MKKTLTILFSCLATSMMAQGTLADYNRAYGLREKFSAKKILHSGVEPHWIDDTETFWYKTTTEEGEVYVKIDPATGSRSVQQDTTGLHIKARPQWPRDNGEDGHYWSETDDERKAEPATSPDGKYTAYVHGWDIAVKDSTGQERVLTMDGCPGNYYSAYIYWAPDSRHFAVCKIRSVEKRYVYYVEAAPKDQFNPKLHKQEYQKPGDDLMQKTPVIFDAETGKQVRADYEKISNQYGLEYLQWSDNETFTFEYNQRGHQQYSLMAMSAKDGSLRTIVEDKSDKYVNWTRIWRHHFADTKRLLWTSERDNYNHLYLVDKQTGELRQITKGAWYVRQVQYVDEAQGVVYFSANGMNKQEDPYFIHYYRIGLDGKNLVALTPEAAMHRATLSPDHRYLVDVYSTPSEAPVAVLRSADDGKVVMPLEKADISALLAEGWQAPEVFHAKGRDGKTEMWGNIYRPSNLDPTKKYPIIEYIYSGPGDQYVPKVFKPYDYYMSSLAELGFIVVMVDGMTTSFRSKQFEEVCYKNLKDGGYPDHRLWIEAAAKRYPYMDLERVGIYGCSAGGQEAMSHLLLHPDFYKAGYAACGCHDNRMDKIWWNEQWLGYPLDKSYLEGSNIENAKLLSRPLMICWGELDDNIDPSSSMKVVDALIKANKEFEMFIVPGAHHTMGEDWGEHKRYDFFVRHLLGLTPPLWSEIQYPAK